MANTIMQRLPVPPFSPDTALAKVQAAEAVWNTRDSKKVTQTYSPDCIWRNREEVFQGRAAIEYILKRIWAITLDCRLDQEIWAFTNNRISLRLEYEWQHATTSQWYRSHGNEHWQFDMHGYMTRRDMSANDIPIKASDKRI